MVGAYVHGDDILLRQIVVWHWDSGARALTGPVALPRDGYRWSFVDHDGALVVGTASSADHDGTATEGRTVSVVTREGESVLPCP